MPMMPMEVSNKGVRSLDGKLMRQPPRMLLYIVKGNKYPVVEWQDDDGTRHTGLVAKLSLNLPELPAPAPELPAPAPKLRKKKP